MTVRPTELGKKPITTVDAIRASRHSGKPLTGAAQNSALKKVLQKDPALYTAEDRLLIKNSSPETIMRAENQLNTAKLAKENNIIRQTVENPAKNSVDVFKKAGLMEKTDDQLKNIINKPSAELTSAERTILEDVKNSAIQKSNNAIAKQNGAINTAGNSTTAKVSTPAGKSGGLLSAEELIDKQFAERASRNTADALKKGTTINPNAPKQITFQPNAPEVPKVPAQTNQIVEKYAEGFSKNHPGVNTTTVNPPVVSNKVPTQLEVAMKRAKDIEAELAKQTANSTNVVSNKVPTQLEVAMQRAKDIEAELANKTVNQTAKPPVAQNLTRAERIAAAKALENATKVNPNAPLMLTDQRIAGDITEKIAEGATTNHPGVNAEVAAQRAKAAEPKFWSKIKNNMPKSPEWLKKVGKWYNVSLGETATYKRMSQAGKNLLARGAAKGSETFIGSSSMFLQKVAGKMGEVAQSGIARKLGATKLLSRGNILVAGLFEAPAIVEAYKEGLGRGIAQTVQSGTKVGLGALGGAAAVAGLCAAGILSGPIGWGALAVGIVGSMLGYKVGDMLTGWLGKNKKGLFEKEQTVPPAPTTPAAPAFGTMTTTSSLSYPYDIYNNPLAGLPPIQ